MAGEERITVELRNGALRVQGSGAPPMQLTPLGEHRFHATVFDLLDARFVFDVSDGDVARSVRATWGFNDAVFRRVDRDP